MVTHDPSHPYTLAPSLVFTAATPTSDAPVLFEMDSTDALVFIGPIVGPTGTMLINLLARWLKQHAELGNDEFEVTLDELACHLGHLQQGNLLKALDRLRRFNLVTPVGGLPLRSEVQTQMRLYPFKWLDRLPPATARTLLDWQRTLTGS